MTADYLDELAGQWRKLCPKDKLYLYNTSKEEIQHLIATDWRFLARESQMVDKHFSDKIKIVVDKTGRGGGKTREGAEWCIDRLLEGKDGMRIGVSNKTYSDVQKINFEGESGLIAVLKRRGYERVDSNPIGKQFCYAIVNCEITLAGDKRLRGISGEKPDTLAGHQFHVFWFDELALYQRGEYFWQQASMTIRLGDVNKRLVTTTPRPHQWFRKICEREDTYVQTGSTFDNSANLTDDYLNDMITQLDGTRLGLQELYGQILDDNPGALWNPLAIEELRVKEIPCEIVRVVMAIDPAVTTTEQSDETGIVVAALGEDGFAYVLADLSVRQGLDKCLSIINDGFRRYQVDRIVGETNQGGDLIQRFIRSIGVSIPFKGVRAKKGKYTRAEPVAALYEQGRVRHVGIHPKLENQMCSFTHDMSDSPDRVDAMVYAITELMLMKADFAMVI